MAIHTDLPIYRTGVQLLGLAIDAQVQMPRSVKRILGDTITAHCVKMLDLMAMANATQHAARAQHIERLLVEQRALTVLLRQAAHSHAERARLARAVLDRGHCVNGALTKAYRRS